MFDKLRRAYNAFRRPPPNEPYTQEAVGPSSSARPDRPTLRFYNDKSIISSIYTRMAIDISGVEVRHVQVDDEERYTKDMDSTLNYCFDFEPNMDQSPRPFRQDVVMTLFDRGAAALVPVDTDIDPKSGEKFDVLSLRVGEIVAWYPKHVRVNVYNENTGLRQEITLPKRYVAIVENPLYTVMNSPNSTLQRLIRKLALLDTADELSASGKLDLIIQLPYVIKSQARREQAEQRRQDIEFQLKGSQYGIAYTDGTEKITQLNRPAENNLLTQVEYLTNMLYSQLGLTTEVMDGTADEKAMLNYMQRTIEPIMDAMVQAMTRAFLGIPGIRNNERVQYFRDPFKFVPIGQMADIIDKLSRNEIVTANEFRQVLGLKPSTDPKADKLLNSNMPQPPDQVTQLLERNSQNGT